jgi:hypothetical protein
MKPSFIGLLAEFRAEAESDIIGLWEVIKELKSRFGPMSDDELRVLTLKFVQEMLSDGFEVGDPPYSELGYRPWENQSVEYVTKKIGTEWKALEREPNIADVAWFRRPNRSAK